jgi:hypothetical protein
VERGGADVIAQSPGWEMYPNHTTPSTLSAVRHGHYLPDYSGLITTSTLTGQSDTDVTFPTTASQPQHLPRPALRLKRYLPDYSGLTAISTLPAHRIRRYLPN